MPTLGDIAEFFQCQAFGRTSLPTNVDLSGQTIVVTGANTGLGLEACKHLARMHPACIVLACRNIAKGETAREAIYNDTACRQRTEVLVWELDLSRQSSVRSFIDRVMHTQELERVDAVVANAGVEMETYVTSESMEETLKVNVLSTMHLCLGLLPKLSETAQLIGKDTHLTLVGSLIHLFGADSELHAVPESQSLYDGLSDPRHAKMTSRYPLSKLMEHLCFNELLKTHAPGNVIINIVNPGWCGTELSRHRQQPLSERFWFSILGRTAEEGSRALVHGLCAGKSTHGKYLSECTVKRQSMYVSSARGRQMSGRLWKETLGKLHM